MSKFQIGGATIEVAHIGENHDPDEGHARQTYRCDIKSDELDFSNEDILGPPGEPVHIGKAAQTVFSHLYHLGLGEPLAIEHPLALAGWAMKHRDELKAAALAMQYVNQEIPVASNGHSSPAEPDEQEDLFG